MGLIGPSVRDGFLLGEPLLSGRAHFLSDAGQQEACPDEGADGRSKEERRALWRRSALKMQKGQAPVFRHFCCVRATHA